MNSPEKDPAYEYWEGLYGSSEKMDNATCAECREKILKKYTMGNTTPLPHVGRNYSDQEKKIMFVGRDGYGGRPICNYQDSNFQDFTPEEMLMAFEKSDKVENKNTISPFWDWIRDISMGVFDKDGDYSELFDRIAYSNIIKCSVKSKDRRCNRCDKFSEISDRKKVKPNCCKYIKNGCLKQDKLDKAKFNYYSLASEYCIRRGQYLYKEINILNPNYVILFLGRANHNLVYDFLNIKEEDYMGEKINYYPLIEALDNHDINKINLLFLFLQDKNEKERSYIITLHPQGACKEIKEAIIRIISNSEKSSEYWQIPEIKEVNKVMSTTS